MEFSGGCLRWNNHQSTLVQYFDTLLESGTLVDCTLAAEGKTLKAHKVILSACSPYFECLLSEHYDRHPVFILKDVKFKELKAMMDYMYKGEVNISQDQLAALLKAAESLQIKGLSESKTAGSNKTESRAQKTVSQPTASSLDIPHASSSLMIEKNKVPRQSLVQSSVGDLPKDSASSQVSKGLSSREGSQSPTSRKRRSLTEDSTVENQDASNSNDIPQQMGVPALGIAPVTDEKVHADPTDSLSRSALMMQLTKPADEMLQLPLEKPEPNDNLIEPKSEYLKDAKESVEDLMLDEDMNDFNDMDQDNNRAGPSHVKPEIFLNSQTEASDNENSWISSKYVAKLKKKFECPHCKIIFEQRHNLIHHIKMTCLLNPNSNAVKNACKFICDKCGRGYKEIKCLRYHKKHECQKITQCPKCKKVFHGINRITERHKQRHCLNK